jgi:xylulokinase
LPHLRLGSPPFPDPVGRGAFLGISSGTSRGTLFRAVLEGIALDGGNMLKAMLNHLGGQPPDRILAIGGSTRNQLLMRLKASVYGSTLAVMDLADTTCLGAALLGGLAAGVFQDIEDARRDLRVPVGIVEPDPYWTEDYRQRRQATYAAAYAALRPLHARLLDG